MNANAIWDLGTAIAVTERELGISEADEVEPEADSIKFNLVDVVTDGSAKTFIYEEKTND